MFAYFIVIFILPNLLVYGSPEKENPPRVNPQSDVGLPGGQQDWWKWRNNPLYSDYWQRDPLRRPWTTRPGYGYTYSPDTQYTYQTYDTPELFGYDSNYPGGRTHFIGYKTQGRKTAQGQIIDPINWNKFNNGPTTEINKPIKSFDNIFSNTP
ncbi:uncharacterized protein LOC142331099 [Lycorma delicatula]|uniref:uncharacterized protein LOC142331099 n=1 Tax=Lycorma delicatula TaxID=130591 RepID=UPI003F51208E